MCACVQCYVPDSLDPWAYVGLVATSKNCTLLCGRVHASRSECKLPRAQAGKCIYMRHACSVMHIE